MKHGSERRREGYSERQVLARVEDIDLSQAGTVHNAVPDYRPDEPRYMRRVQVMATRDYARLAA